MSAGWKGVRKAAPCPACGEADRCAWSEEGYLHCFRSKEPPQGMRFHKDSTSDERGAIFAPEHVSRRATKPVVQAADGFDLAKLQAQFVLQSSEALRQQLAIQLGVTAASLVDLGVGWVKRSDLGLLKANGAAWPGNRPKFASSFPEYDAQRCIVGFSFRAEDGRKGSPSGRAGCRRGLIIPTSFDTATGPVLVVEGASDVAALSVLGLRAVGRPSNTGGGEMLAALLRGVEDVVIVGENDRKPDGSHPGRDGMVKVAGHLAKAWSRPVRQALPPSDCKDVRAWLQARTEGGLDLDDHEACEQAGRDLLGLLMADSGVVQFAPDDTSPDDAQPRRKDERPELHILAGELHLAAERAERLLNAGDPHEPLVFQRQGTLVRTVRLETSLKGRISVEAGATVIREANEPFLLDRISRVARAIRYDKNGNPYNADPPLSLARAIQSHAGAWPLPYLAGVVEAPQIFADGRVLDQEGYDAQSGLVLRTRGVQFGLIPTAPTKDDAVAALRLIDEALLSGFAFVGDCDRSVALALILSAVGRSTYGQGPAIGATAPNRSCGKSTLLRLGALLATGRGPALIDPGATDEESDKRILAVLADGHRFISFDNLRSAEQLDTPSIAKAITEPVYTGRPLGKTATLSLSTDGVLFMFSGVNLEPRGDTVSRCVLIRLDPAVERPWAQHWATRDPTEVALERRGELVAAALTVLRAFIAAGCPDQGCEPYRLAEWNRVIRNAVIWCGYADPLAGMAALEAHDPESEPCIELMSAWRRVLGGRAVMAADVVSASESDDELKSALLAVAASNRTVGLIEPRRLGRFLARYERRVVGGSRFVRLDNSGTRAVWALQEIEQARSFAVTAVPSTPSLRGCAGESDIPVHTTRACAHALKGGARNCENGETAEDVEAGSAVWVGDGSAAGSADDASEARVAVVGGEDPTGDDLEFIV